jgi:hypothetical protein
MLQEPCSWNMKIEDFRSRFQSFREIDYKTYPYCFGEFWKWKLRTETENEHILDARHIEETHKKLGETLKRWRWNRPYKHAELAERLRRALENIRDAYDQIRKYSLLEFNSIPDEPLKLIWHELGCVKTKEEKSRSGYYLIMGTTKPLMLLWGQTPAFDSVVRAKMPKFGIPRLTDNYWDFMIWKTVLTKFQEGLKQQPEVIQVFREVSREEYGSDSITPYGQFLDLYYWTR